MPIDSRVTVLFLSANPLDMDSLRLSYEVRNIKAALRQAQYASHFDVQDEWAVQISDLRRVLLRYASHPLILHFAGHGDTGAIYLEDDTQNSQAVAAPALARFLGLFPNIQCVVLNACYSEAIGDALAEVVPCVIGMATDLADANAVHFAEAFYEAVGAGKPLEQAFMVAEASLGMEGLLDTILPTFIQGRRSDATADQQSDKTHNRSTERQDSINSAGDNDSALSASPMGLTMWVGIGVALLALLSTIVLFMMVVNLFAR